MHQRDVATASRIIGRLKEIHLLVNGRLRDVNRSFDMEPRGHGTPDRLPLSKAAIAAAHRVAIAELQAEAAELRRRAAQIGLTLEN